MTFRGFSLFFSGKKMYKGCKYNHYLDSAAKTQQAKWHKCRQQPGPTAVGAFHQIRPKTAKFEDQPQVEQPNGQVVEEKLRQKLKGCLYQEDNFKTMPGFIMASKPIFWETNFHVVAMWWQHQCCAWIIAKASGKPWKFASWHGMVFSWREANRSSQP